MSKGFSDLENELVKAFFRIKHLTLPLHADPGCGNTDFSVAEIELMKAVRHNILESDENAYICDIQALLSISKAGASKMLSVLEKKGYLTREIHPENRRWILITLTPEGHKVLEELRCREDALFKRIIGQLGETETAQFIDLTNKFVDITLEGGS